MSGVINSEVPSGAPSDDGGRVNYGPEGEGTGGRGYGSSYGGRGGGYGGGGNSGGGYGGGGNSGGRDRRPGGAGGGGGGGGGAGAGGGRGGGQRDGDWVCPNSSCGNVNFARRVECNKCGTGKPSGGTQPVSSNSGYGGGVNRGYRSSGHGGGDYGAQSGSGGYRQSNNPGGYGSANDYGNQAAAGGGGASGGYGYGSGGSQVPSNAPPAGNFYGGQAAPPRGDYGGHALGESRGSRGGDYGGDSRGSRGGDYGGGHIHGDSGGSRGQGGYDNYGSEKGSSYSDTRGGYGGEDVKSGSQYGGGSEAVKVKQCDENCGETCDNARIYISGLPLDVTIEELRDLFGGIGQVAKIKQKRGYKDQWPWNIKIYTDNAGQNKGDAVLVYEDPSAAHSAGGFYNDHVLRGHQIKVTMAEKSAPRPSGGGGYGQGRGGDRGGHGGPDRRFGGGGGHRSRPY